jgi:glycerol-3-phosphate dehydrogenase
MSDQFQIAVIGGGINGVGIAREAASRGFTTLLCEKEDFAHSTSGNSSKLIHGGIRYLEQGEFGLVRESLKERKILLRTAPHLVHPVRINIPVYEGDPRPPWMISAGARLYDWFAGRDNLNPSLRLDSKTIRQLPGIRQEGLKSVIQYSDAQALDSRLTLETALSAKTLGASIANYTEVTEIRPAPWGYQLTLLDRRRGTTWTCKTRYLINAAGPWVPGLDQRITERRDRPKLRLIRGIHFVIKPKLHSEGFLLLPRDGRVIFVLPWTENHSLIGTTESDYRGDPLDNIPPSDDEIKYLQSNFKEYFPGVSLELKQVLHTYSGVRCIVDRGETQVSKMQREALILHESRSSRSGYFAILGGKLTSHRSLAVQVISSIETQLVPEEARRCNTETEPLYGAYPIEDSFSISLHRELDRLQLPESVLNRWKRIYGSRWVDIAQYYMEKQSLRETVVGSDYVKAELRYNIRDEMAAKMDDVLLRRTKLIYGLSAEQKEDFQKAMDTVEW